MSGIVWSRAQTEDCCVMEGLDSTEGKTWKARNGNVTVSFYKELININLALKSLPTPSFHSSECKGTKVSDIALRIKK